MTIFPHMYNRDILKLKRWNKSYGIWKASVFAPPVEFCDLLNPLLVGREALPSKRGRRHLKLSLRDIGFRDDGWARPSLLFCSGLKKGIKLLIYSP